MSDTVIKVENLGKKYVIRHQQNQRYTALRDVLTNKAISLGKKLLHPFALCSMPFADSSREEFWALKDVSFEVKQGDRIGIIGRNGAGKTTLLKLLSRITEPTTGRIAIKGRVASLLEVGTGFHPELTGRENIFLNGAILGMTKNEIKRKFDEIVEFAEIEKFLDTPVKRYSSGMYVRLAFAVAAHLEPEILLVDEVLAVGDAAFQKKCLGKMENVSTREGRTVLFVSHNMPSIGNLCGQAIQLSDGKVSITGRAIDVVHHYMAEFNGDEEFLPPSGSLLAQDEELDVTLFHGCDAQGLRKKFFTTSDKVSFKIGYRLKQHLQGLRVGLDFLSVSDGEVIFRSFDDDMIPRQRAPGPKEVICSIPSHLLKPGVYLARLQIGVHNVRWIVNGSVSEKITVELIDGVNKLYGDYRPGKIMPRTEWIYLESGRV
jgi:lipopolysaccharide transport system ATP-binding protein